MADANEADVNIPPSSWSMVLIKLKLELTLPLTVNPVRVPREVIFD